MSKTHDAIDLLQWQAIQEIPRRMAPNQPRSGAVKRQALLFTTTNIAYAFCRNKTKHNENTPPAGLPSRELHQPFLAW